jgi:uncharacterized membrane protein YcgQ (UPF0703/DUF1980 family)
MQNRKNSSFLLLLPLLALMTLSPAIPAANRPIPVSYQEYTQLDIGDILSNGPKASIQELLSSKILLKGKVFKSLQLKKDEIVVYRMIITCCVADALPSGIVVKLPGKMQFHDEDWVEVEGTIQLLPFNETLKTVDPVANMVWQGNVYPYFTAVKAYKVSAPSSEYLYY